MIYPFSGGYWPRLHESEKFNGLMGLTGPMGPMATSREARRPERKGLSFGSSPLGTNDDLYGMANHLARSRSPPSRSLGTDLRIGIGRGLAAFLGAFSLLNLAGDARHPGFDANLWWIDLRPLPDVAARAVLAAAGVLLVAYAIRPACRRWRHRATAVTMVVLLVWAVFNAVSFHLLVARGAIASGWPVAFSWLVAVALALIAVALRGPLCLVPARSSLPQRGILILTVGLCLLGFPLAQMACFGLTDYRRPADAAVVFGARVYANGQPSLALADRVRTGCRLYLDGFVDTIIFSGGPGDGATHETEAMRQLALRLGVPAGAILIDARGVSTEATARHTSDMFAARGITRVLAVSHFYHLPRIKLTYQRYGWAVYTVPARQSRILARLPQYMVREIAALWVYHLRPLMQPAGAGVPKATCR